MKKIIKILFKTTYEGIKDEGYKEAIKDILVFKDKIYTGNITLPGTEKVITNCTFLGNEYGLRITPESLLKTIKKPKKSKQSF